MAWLLVVALLTLPSAAAAGEARGHFRASLTLVASCSVDTSAAGSRAPSAGRRASGTGAGPGIVVDTQCRHGGRVDVSMSRDRAALDAWPHLAPGAEASSVRVGRAGANGSGATIVTVTF